LRALRQGLDFLPQLAREVNFARKVEERKEVDVDDGTQRAGEQPPQVDVLEVGADDNVDRRERVVLLRPANEVDEALLQVCNVGR